MPRTVTDPLHIVDAIEAFVDAKITYARRAGEDPGWASSVDVDATRGFLVEKIAEALSAA